MAANQAQPFLLAYDIANPKRLIKVHRTVKGYGMPLQYSVFLVVATANTLEELLSELDNIIDSKDDDIRVYPLPRQFDTEQFGRQWLPTGIDIASDASLTDALIAMVAEQNNRATGA